MKYRKLLIVDDDKKNIFALGAFLRSKHFTCITAAGAAEGLNLLLNETGIGAVLIDMMMPDMDGYEAILQIRLQPAFRQLPVIAVTANAMVGDKEKCLAAGADHYISKPVDIDALVKLLDEYLK